jgi:hypothetical protein
MLGHKQIIYSGVIITARQVNPQPAGTEVDSPPSRLTRPYTVGSQIIVIFILNSLQYQLVCSKFIAGQVHYKMQHREGILHKSYSKPLLCKIFYI